jgi:hypothetical protein
LACRGDAEISGVWGVLDDRVDRVALPSLSKSAPLYAGVFTL